MFEDVEQRNQIICVSLEHRQIGQSGRRDLSAEPFRRKRAGAIIQLTGFDHSETPKHFKVVASPAPDLQEAWSSRPRYALDQRREDASARPEPPMLLVELCHPVENGAFHKPSSGLHCHPASKR
jgi:hypothetical protein